MSDYDDSDDEPEGSLSSSTSADNDDRLADLGRRNVERFFNGAVHRGAFEQILAARQFLPPQSHSNSASGSVVSRSSDTSSMAVSDRTASTAGRSGSPVPTLVSWPSVDSSSRLSSRRDSVIGNVYNLEDAERGLTHISLVRGERPCSFSFLNCGFRSACLEEWDAHCHSHFRGHLPTRIHCPFRDCAWEASTETSNHVWHSRFLHILGRHKDDLDVNTTDRPPRYLVGHLWRTGVISNAQQKEIHRNGRLSGDVPFISRGGPTRDRRSRRST